MIERRQLTDRTLCQECFLEELLAKAAKQVELFGVEDARLTLAELDAGISDRTTTLFREPNGPVGVVRCSLGPGQVLVEYRASEVLAECRKKLTFYSE